MVMYECVPTSKGPKGPASRRIYKGHRAVRNRVFSDMECFCRPLCLICFLYEGETDVNLHFCDGDDNEEDCVYRCTSVSEAEKVFHELINYLYDTDGAYLKAEDIFSGKIFPDIPGVRKRT